MTTATSLIVVACPAWCAVPAETHLIELADGSTFHRSRTIDEWNLEYDDHPVSVLVDHYVPGGEADRDYRPTINIQGKVERGCQDLAELDVADARRLATAMLAACDLAEAPRMSVAAEMKGTTCPDWCDDHTGHDDGSADWHKTADVAAGAGLFYISTGSLSGGPELFVAYHPNEGVALADAEAFARAILASVNKVRP